MGISYFNAEIVKATIGRAEIERVEIERAEGQGPGAVAVQYEKTPSDRQDHTSDVRRTPRTISNSDTRNKSTTTRIEAQHGKRTGATGKVNVGNSIGQVNKFRDGEDCSSKLPKGFRGGFDVKVGNISGTRSCRGRGSTGRGWAC